MDQSNVDQFDDQLAVPYVASWTCEGVLKGSEVAQSFVAGMTGRLDQVSMVLWRSNFDAAPLTVSIRALRPDGAPTATVLGSGSYGGAGSEYSPGQPPTFTKVWLTEPAQVVAGQSYAIVANTPPADSCVQPAGWYLAGSGPTYSSGKAWTLDRFPSTPDWYPYPGDSDLWFTTWVLPV